MEKYLMFKGWQVKDGDGLYLQTTQKFFRGPLPGISRCLKANAHDAGVVDGSRIRYIAPPECLRLMGVNEGNIAIVTHCGISENQLYKIAGNSIVVDVLEHIFRKLLIDRNNENAQMSLFQ